MDPVGIWFSLSPGDRSGGQRSHRLSSATWKSRDGGDPNSWLVYPLVNIQKNYGKSPFLMGKLTISMAISIVFCMFTRGYFIEKTHENG